MIKVGDALPAVTLMEYVEVEGNGCSLGPNPVKLPEALAGKTIAVFAVPGAFTPTCSKSTCQAMWPRPKSSRLRAWTKSGAWP
jgi:peroxiredoxin